MVIVRVSVVPRRTIIACDKHVSYWFRRNQSSETVKMTSTQVIEMLALVGGGLMRMQKMRFLVEKAANLISLAMLNERKDWEFFHLFFNPFFNPIFQCQLLSVATNNSPSHYQDYKNLDNLSATKMDYLQLSYK